MRVKTEGEKIKCWRLPGLPGVELLQAAYVTQSFAKHVHDGYAFGVIESGSLKFSYQGKNWTAESGDINLVIPGEAHDGRAGSPAGWAYRMFYLEPAALQTIMHALSEDADACPFFRPGVIRDTSLAGPLWQMHKLFEAAAGDAMERESRLLACLAPFILKYADKKITLPRGTRENKAVAMSCEYIEAKYRENISLRDLAAVSGFSPYYLIRVFARQRGVSPHIYLKQIRIKAAKKLLAQALPLAFIAVETGFSDQSHFSRQFKQITGLTPAAYGKMLQSPAG